MFQVGFYAKNGAILEKGRKSSMTTLVGAPSMLPLITIIPSEGYAFVTKALEIRLALPLTAEQAARK